MNKKSSFRERVYTLTKQIPLGKVATYGQLAKMAGSPGASRAVGMCMKNNPDSLSIPCHRVVAANGKLTGYAFGGTSVKKEKLLKEGIMFTNDKVDLSVSQWQIN